MPRSTAGSTSVQFGHRLRRKCSVNGTRRSTSLPAGRRAATAATCSTPNLDHVAPVPPGPGGGAAYERVFLARGQHAHRRGLEAAAAPGPGEVSGSDLFEPLMARCARDHLPVFFMGATAEACAPATRSSRSSHPGIEIAGYDASTFDLDANPEGVVAALRHARASGARLIVVCLPPRKQHSCWPASSVSTVRRSGIGAGSALSFYVAEVRRAPAWISRLGFEWLYRLHPGAAPARGAGTWSRTWPPCPCSPGWCSTGSVAGLSPGPSSRFGGAPRRA